MPAAEGPVVMAGRDTSPGGNGGGSTCPTDGGGICPKGSTGRVSSIWSISLCSSSALLCG